MPKTPLNADQLAQGDDIARRRRHAAGENPQKRSQILQGALQIFLDNGFDAASMNDICRAAGVSKGTLYVYFASKEDLFESLINHERERMFQGIEQLLETEAPIAERLRLCARRLVEIICSDQVIRAQRIIIGTAERMPVLCARFYESGTNRAQRGLCSFFESACSTGDLSIDDIPLAAHQFAELSTAGLWRPRLFGKLQNAPTDAEIDRSVTGAVTVFLAAYQVQL
jgi:AcrR family transcriptional regulator